MTQPAVEHFVVLMLENRSFDHMLGLAGVGSSGLLQSPGQVNPAFTNSAQVGGQTRNYPAAAGADYVIAAEQIDRKGFGGPGHSFPDATLQVYGTEVAPDPLPEPAPMSGFAQSYARGLMVDAHISRPTAQQVQVPMLAFTPDKLPVLATLAREFCTCDHWFCEIPGPTQPNRLFVHAGTAAGLAHNVWNESFDDTTIYEELEKVGRDWGVFYFDLRDTDCYPQIKKRARIEPFQSFYGHVSDGTLPAYSFLCPRYNESRDPSQPAPNSQHAPYDVRNGENLIADVYEALRASPLWAKTALIITYDENGGYYDHVSPPIGVSNPDGLTSPTAADRAAAARNARQSGYLLKPDYVFDFTRLGPRVPAVVVSPLIPRGTVIDRRLQHTSIFATLRDIFGVGVLTRRDAEAASFADAFSLPAARDDAPQTLTRPPADDAPAVDTLGAPLTHQQTEMWPLLSHLDGHRDSGKVTEPPATRGEAADYIQERIVAHNTFHRERRRRAAYHVLRVGTGAFTWRLLDETGQELAHAAELYPTEAAAEARIASLRDVAPFARQTTPQPIARRDAASGPRRVLSEESVASAAAGAFDQLCSRLQQIDLFGAAGDVQPRGRALEQAIGEGGAQLPVIFQTSYLQPLERALPRLAGARGDPTTLETLTAAVYQHRPRESLAVPLGRFLAVVSDLYQSFLDRDKRANIGLALSETLPPLAMFQHTGDAGPFTLPVDDIENLIGGAVGVVSMPATYARHPAIWAALAHETGGHDVTHADAGLLPELASGVSAAFTGLPADPSVAREDLASLWAYWIDEATADVYGLLNIGPAFAPNLAAFFVALNARGSGTPGLRSNSGYSAQDPDHMLDPHPTDILRLHLAMGVVDSLSGLSPPARQAYLSEIGALADKLASDDHVGIVGNISRSDSNALQAIQLSVPLAYMQRAARAVGSYIASAKLESLCGHGVQDIETWDDQDEARAQAVKLALLAGSGITGLGDDAQLLAGVTLALLARPDRYDEVTAALDAGLDDSFKTDVIWGAPPADRVWIRYASGIFAPKAGGRVTGEEARTRRGAPNQRRSSPRRRHK
jgi:phospholipase C